MAIWVALGVALFTICILFILWCATDPECKEPWVDDAGDGGV